MPQLIWKYTFRKPTILESVSIPEGYKWLSAGVQDNAVVVWALIDPGMPKQTAHLLFAATGATIPEGIKLGELLGRVEDNGYVFHVFEVLPDEV